jgi:hypothetical protein
MTITTRRFLRGRLAAALALGASLPWGTDADAHLRFKKLKGGLTTTQVPCATLCTEGPLTGGLAGQLEFVMESMTETQVPDVATYQGVNVITTATGTLTGNDYGVWNLATGEFVDYTYFTSGTGAYEGVRGSLVIAGVFDPVSGTGSSNYTALLTF